VFSAVSQRKYFFALYEAHLDNPVPEINIYVLVAIQLPQIKKGEKIKLEICLNIF
jgi:hypothetical protein